MSKYIPNAFQVPNGIVDEIMAEISGNALKCYLLIIRKTIGWNKEMDYIPASQFHDLTGIKKPHTLQACIVELEQFQLIEVVRTSGKVSGYKIHSGQSQPLPENGTTTTAENGQYPKTAVDTKNGTGFNANHVRKRAVPKIGSSADNGHQPLPQKGTATSAENGHTSKPNTKPTNTKPNIIGSKKFDPKKIELPKNIDREIWNAFVDMRNLIKKPMTERATQSLITKLIGFEDQANASLDQSIVGCWQNVFLPNQDYQPTQTPKAYQIQTIEDQLKRQTDTTKTKTSVTSALAGLELIEFKKLVDLKPHVTQQDVFNVAKAQAVDYFAAIRFLMQQEELSI